DTGVAEHLRRERELRVETPLLAVGVDPRQALPAELRDERRVGLPRDVDEAAAAVAQRLVDGGRVETERARDDQGLALRLGHLARVGVDRLRLLADRELYAPAVVDRSARGRDDDVRAVLVRGEAA